MNTVKSHTVATTTAPTTAPTSRPVHRRQRKRDDVRRIAGMVVTRWPSALGLVVLTANSAGGPDAHVTAMIIMLAALCYLAAAALGSRRSAWSVLAVAVVAVTVAMETSLDAIVMLLVGAAGFLGYGLLRGSRTDRRELVIQAAGFLGFTAVGLTAMMVSPVAAAYMAAAAAFGHGLWDVAHHLRDKVVPRSLAEFCFVLDTGLGAVLLITAWSITP